MRMTTAPESCDPTATWSCVANPCPVRAWLTACDAVRRAGSRREGREEGGSSSVGTVMVTDRMEFRHDRNRSTAPSQRRRRPDVVRHPRRRQGRAADRPVPVPGDQRRGSAARTAAPTSRASTAPVRRTRPARSRSPTTPTIPPSSSGPTRARRRWSSCCTPSPRASPSGLANIAAARGITLRRVSSTVEGDIDLLGILGLSDAVRNGYRQIRVHFDVEGDASPEELAALVERSRRRSAVYDVLANGTDVQIDVSTPVTRPLPSAGADSAGTSSSSEPGSPARRPRCCLPAPACRCWS